jgi:UDP-glucuronate 4-epimerase
MHILVTGAAGFIGMATTQRLLARGDTVLGLDNLNDYYDVGLKHARLQRLLGHARFRFMKQDVAHRQDMQKRFATERYDRVIHLAAQAGVRYSLENPHAYIDSNVTGFMNVLEGCRHSAVQHLVYASSSSVYGGNVRLPFLELHGVDHPVSLYAATKKANELMAHTYSYLYGLPSTGLRFFTVYGTWGRPDMALFLFTKAILEGRPIEVFNFGAMQRDFTYVDDIVEAIVRVLDTVATPRDSQEGLACEVSDDPSTSQAPYRVFNVGNQHPASLLDFVACIEQALDKKAHKTLLPLQAGDVPRTCASSEALQQWVGFVPATPLAVGVGHFVNWYRTYYPM